MIRTLRMRPARHGGRMAAFCAVVGLAVWGAGTTEAAPAPLYRDASAPVAKRVDDLIGRMTLKEKLAQIVAAWNRKSGLFDDAGRFDAVRAAQAFPDGIGQITRLSDTHGVSKPQAGRWRDTADSVQLANAIQHWAVEKTRLGIPVLFHEEGLHGYATLGATSFPQAIALASSWDPELVRDVNAVTAREMAARGVKLALTPVIDVARDPRWGRIEETFGEDPYLVGELGVAAIEGLQGDALPLAPDKVFATLKHFTGHGQPESGTNVGPAEISERTLRENFFPPFEAAVTRTNVRFLMPSYNEIDGVPSHRNGWLLQKVLRGEWGYKGAVVSDYGGVEELDRLHHVVPDLETAAIVALRTGVDMNLPDGEAFATLYDAVRRGRLHEREIDVAVRRVLTLKFEAGLFEHPYVDPAVAEKITGTAEADALALKAAERAAVLLKNSGVLPLSADRIGTLAVIGPNAAPVRLGGYAGIPPHGVGVLDGLKARLGTNGRIVFAEGVKILADKAGADGNPQLADPAENRARIAAAVAAAQSADTILLVLGDTEQTCREAIGPGHLGDRDALTLPGQQMELAAAIFALKKPTVVVLLNGRPPALGEIAEKADAIVEGWYLGQDGGTAMAKILFGDVNPGGHLPVSFPRSVGQLPVFYNAKPSARRGYLFSTTAPQYPFGWGLSYTTFRYGAPKLSAAEMRANGSVAVSVEVTNTGARAGDTVVQMYVHQQVSSVTRPLKELKGFRRIHLEAGESATVRFAIDRKTLQFWDIAMERTLEPGVFDILVGENSAELQSAELRVVN